MGNLPQWYQHRLGYEGANLGELSVRLPARLIAWAQAIIVWGITKFSSPRNRALGTALTAC